MQLYILLKQVLEIEITENENLIFTSSNISILVKLNKKELYKCLDN